MTAEEIRDSLVAMCLDTIRRVSGQPESLAVILDALAPVVAETAEQVEKVARWRERLADAQQPVEATEAADVRTHQGPAERKS